MKWKDLGNIIKPIAPILASALPGGSVAASAVTSILSAALGTEETPDAIAAAIKDNPENAIKIIELQNTHKLELERTALSLQLAELADIQNARAMNIEIYKAKGRNIQSDVLCFGLILILAFVVIAVVGFGAVVPGEMLVGITNLVLMVVSFHFGSSIGSKQNGEALRQMAASNGGKNGNGNGS